MEERDEIMERIEKAKKEIEAILIKYNVAMKVDQMITILPRPEPKKEE